MSSSTPSSSFDTPMTFLIPVRNISAHFNNLRIHVEANYRLGDEVIVINDHSDDGTGALLNTWSKMTPYINIIQNHGQRGLIPALNLGLSLATKDWVARFDADDVYRPDRIQIQSELVQEGNVAVFSDYKFISESGSGLGAVPSAIYPLQSSLSLTMGNRTAHPSVIFNRVAALEAGAYRIQDYLAEDLSLWLRMSRFGSIRSVPQVLLHYRLNRSSVTLNARSNSINMRRQVLAEIGINSEDIAMAISDIDSLVEMYSSDSKSSMRKLLFLRDLLNLSQNKKIKNASVGSSELRAKYLAKCLGSVPEIFLARSEKVFRDIYRKGVFISKH
jgi:glycosyltransferase involved in cell wall biosynthesis